jgi:hypothetical protein
MKRFAKSSDNATGNENPAGAGSAPIRDFGTRDALSTGSGLMLLCNAQRPAVLQNCSVPFFEVIIQWQKV